MENLTLRPATVADIDELVRLRALMFTGLAEAGSGWEEACRGMLADRMVADRLFAAFVVGSPQHGGPLVCCGVGWVNLYLPGPTTPDGRCGHVGSVSTDERARRQGHARSVLQALLAWFDELGVTRVDLRAAPMGEGLYRRLGFGPLDGQALTRRPR